MVVITKKLTHMFFGELKPFLGESSLFLEKVVFLFGEQSCPQGKGELKPCFPWGTITSSGKGT